MLNYCKNTSKVFIALFVIILLFFTLQYDSEKFIFMKRLQSRINFITKYPEIKPEKCIKTGKLNEGKYRLKNYFWF